MTDEQWRPIPGYEGYYEVSGQGRVRSVTRTVFTSSGHHRTYRGLPIQLRYNERRGGYPMVALSRSDRKVHYFVHRLVALAFLGPCPEGQEVRHLDGDPRNSASTNLAYGTSSQNKRDKRRHGTDHNVVKTHCPRGHPYDEANTYVLPSRPDARYCRACQNQRARDRRAARSAGQPGRAA